MVQVSLIAGPLGIVVLNSARLCPLLNLNAG